MNDREKDLLTAFQAVYDELTAERPCDVCDDCPVLESFASIIANMRESLSAQYANDLGMKRVDWSKCSKRFH